MAEKMTFIESNEPILQTAHSKIWQVDPQGHEFTVGYWLIYAPWAHAAWDYHAVNLVHLREASDHRPTKFAFAGATHELMIFALNPDHEIDPLNLLVLEPVSVVQQFIAENDSAALGLVEKCIRRIADAELSPDSDFRNVWRHILVDGCAAMGESQDG